MWHVDGSHQIGSLFGNIECILEHSIPDGYSSLSRQLLLFAVLCRQVFLKGRILELESKIAQFQVIDPSTLPDNGKVVFSATVTIEDVETGNRQTVQIVGNDESDTKLGRISVASPMARALIGKSEGDEVEVQAPGGLSEYEIISVQYI